MAYFKAPDNSVHFLDDGEFIYLLPDGVVEITKEEACVLTYVPPVVPVPEPLVVSAFQARAALLQADLLDDVEEYMALPTTDAFTKLAWDKAQEFRENSAMVQSLSVVLGISSVQLKDLFTFAGTITA